MLQKYKVGIIGTGIRAIFLVSEILKNHCLEIVAISDINNDNMLQIRRIYNEKWDMYHDYNELLQRKDIDGIIITSPDYVHEEQAIATLEAGKHLFLDKPLAITLDGAKRVIEAKHRSERILIVGFVLRYDKLYMKMKELINSGIIGEVKTGWVLHSVGSSSDWFFHDWHGKMENTGGLLLQKGCHDFDIINWVVKSNAKKIVATGSKDFFIGEKHNTLICQECIEKNTCSEAIIDKEINLEQIDSGKLDVFYNQWRNQCSFREEIDVLDNHQVVIEYENGVIVSYMENHYTPDDNREYIFIGTKGKLKLDDAAGKITVQLRTNSSDRKEEIVYDNSFLGQWHGDGNKYILEDFVQAMKSGKQPAADTNVGYAALEIALTAHASIRDKEIKYLT